MPSHMKPPYAEIVQYRFLNGAIAGSRDVSWTACRHSLRVLKLVDAMAAAAAA
eukprot:SAG11_NODE_37648_length_256_cov_0.515924_1_plen_52_part_10